MLQKNGIILKPFIIGIGKDFNMAFNCVGTYFDATKEKDLRTALNVVTVSYTHLDVYKRQALA